MITEALKNKVENLLKNYPHLRDSDNKLISTIWFNESDISLNNITAYEFLKNYCNGLYTNAESIRRIRQKLQENFIELRGNSYKKRQSKSTKFRKEIKNL